MMKDVKGLLLMDVDSTLIKEEVIDLLGQEAGLGLEIAEITDRAMNGLLDFQEALTERVNLLKGLPTSVFKQVYQQIHLQKGAKELVDLMHAKGFKVGVVSGGFHEIIDPLAQELKLDYVKANKLEVRGGYLTGLVAGQVVDKEVKYQCLLEWAKENDLELVDTIAVGDGANDLPMIQAAGIGVAFCAKSVVKAQAPYQINKADLMELIPLIEQRGLPKEEN